MQLGRLFSRQLGFGRALYSSKGFDMSKNEVLPCFPDYPPSSLRDPEVEEVVEDVSIGKYSFCHDQQWTPPLFLAAEYGNVTMLQKLIENGHEVNEQDSLGETPLIYAARENKNRAVRFLLHHGAQSDVVNYDGARAEDLTLDVEVSRTIQEFNTHPADEIKDDEEEEEEM